MPLYRDCKCCEKKSRKRPFFPSLFTDVNKSSPAQYSSGQSLLIQAEKQQPNYTYRYGVSCIWCQVQEELNVAQPQNPTVSARRPVIDLGTDQRPRGGGDAWKSQSRSLINCETLMSTGQSASLTLTLTSIEMVTSVRTNDNLQLLQAADSITT